MTKDAMLSMLKASTETDVSGYQRVELGRSGGSVLIEAGSSLVTLSGVKAVDVGEDFVRVESRDDTLVVPLSRVVGVRMARDASGAGFITG